MSGKGGESSETCGVGGISALVADLLPSTAAAILHVLQCPECRRAVLPLLEEAKTEHEEEGITQDFLATHLLRGDAVWEAQEAVRNLLGMSPAERLRAIGEARFRSMDILEQLLQQGRALQSTDPQGAIDLAGLAEVLAMRVFGGSDEDAAEDLMMAASIAGNVSRLSGDWTTAERELQKGFLYAGFLGAEPDGRAQAEVCRGMGLLRWEEGRLLEAEAFLRQAWRVFTVLELGEEASDCLLLLGLLDVERERTKSATQHLRGGLAGQGERESRRPWLIVRSGLSLALVLAKSGRRAEAGEVRRAAMRRYSFVEDGAQVQRLLWVEARVAWALGELEDAAHVLDAVRVRLLEEKDPDAFVCSWDLGVCLVQQARGAEAAALTDDLRQVFRGEGYEEVHRGLGALVRRTALDAPEQVIRGGATLRRLLRARGLRIEPLPYDL
jgi:hypothetical protein